MVSGWKFFLFPGIKRLSVVCVWANLVHVLSSLFCSCVSGAIEPPGGLCGRTDADSLPIYCTLAAATKSKRALRRVLRNLNISLSL